MMADHITDYVADEYALGHLSGPELAHAEEHLLRCEGCRGKVMRAEPFAQAIRETLAGLDQRNQREQSPNSPAAGLGAGWGGRRVNEA